MAPLFVYGVQDARGWWTHAEPGNYRDFYVWIRASWLPMELATIAAGLAALRFWRFPFLVAPIAFALWFMSMDLVPWVFGADWDSWEQRRIVSLWFGLAMLLVAWAVDVRAQGDFAFWLHPFGLLAFWCGLTLLDSDSKLAQSEKGPIMTTISRRQLIAGVALLAAAPRALAASPALEVWKVRGCACCSAWAQHFERAGFAVTMHEVDDVEPVRTAAGVPADLAGCHTARADGYVIEGHVPVAAVQRLLVERPAVAGLAVPGMPAGSPGMEIEGQPAEPFEVIAFTAGGSRYVFG
jgi:hypothetical protein